MSRFKPGQSGNPAGRPKGSLNPQARIRLVIAEDLPRILAVLRDRALDGDIQAASILLSRCLAPLKPEAAPPDIPIDGYDLAERAESITRATLAGELPSSTAAELMGILTQQARIAEITELAVRLERIECALKLEGSKK